MSRQSSESTVEASSSGLDTDLREVFQRSEAPIVSAPEVAESLDISQQAAYARLTTAEENGWVSRKKIGAAAVAWWATTDAFCQSTASE